MLGIVQEQHAERTRLYKQWRQFQWPIVQDALNLLEVKVVPLAIAIDENGVVVSHNASPQFIDSWLEEASASSGQAAEAAKDNAFAKAREQFLWGGDSGLDEAIAEYEKLIDGPQAKSPKAHFELAVCYRNRFERDDHSADFQKAIDHWSKALQIDPNQYIYRRRIEQYGARLGKPYPFYDWVQQARTDIRERGEEPVELKVAISGAEIAQPARKFSTEDVADLMTFEEAEKIDLAPDEGGLIDVQIVAVPASVRPGAAARIHVLASPKENAKWNNGNGFSATLGTVFLLDDVTGVEFSKRGAGAEHPGTEESTETRRFEFEARLSEKAGEPVLVRGAILASVCESETGVCRFIRKPFEFTIQPLGK